MSQRITQWQTCEAIGANTMNNLQLRLSQKRMRGSLGGKVKGTWYTVFTMVMVYARLVHETNSRF